MLDINLIRDGGEVAGAFKATRFVMGQDIVFANRAREAGIKLICATRAYMPHEEMGVAKGKYG